MASTTIISDLKSVQYPTATPTAASTALATGPNGPIGDISGLLANCLLKAQELKQLLGILLGTNPGLSNAMIDSSDPIKSTLTGVAASLT